MKKISVILLVAVLAVGTVFAGLTAIGRVRTAFEWDLDTGNVGFSNGRVSELRYNFDFDTVGSKGDGDVYGEVNAYVNMRLQAPNDGLGTDDPGWTNLEVVDGKVAVRWKFYLNYARLVGPNWSLNIEETLGQPDFVHTYEADGWYPDNGDFHDYAYGYMTAALGYSKAPGISFTYAGKYTLGVGFNKTDATTRLSLQAKAENVELTEGLTLSAAAGYHQISDTSTATEKAIPAALKVAYAKDDLAVTVGADAKYSLIEGEGLGIEAVADASIPVGDVTLKFDAFYMNNTTVRDTDWNYDSKDETESQALHTDTTYTRYGYVLDTNGKINNALSVKVGANIAGFDVSVYGKDLLNQLKIGADVSYSMDKFTFGLNGSFTNNPYGKDATTYKEISIKPSVNYAHDLFSVYGELTATVQTGVGTTFSPYISVTTDTIVSGARLRVDWRGASFGTAQDATQLKGKIRTFAQITF